MAEKNTGGPAFPCRVISYYASQLNSNFQEETIPIYKDTSGMTLRDYFAGQALTGIISNKDLFKMIHDESTDGIDIARKVAELTSVYSDAMIKERNNV